MWSSGSGVGPDGESRPCWWNTSSGQIETDCDNPMMTSSSSDRSDNAHDDSSTKNIMEIYQTWTPVLIFFCALTFFVNVFIVVAARWMRRPLTPTMYFSLSLAAADAIASLTVGLGLVFHRYNNTGTIKQSRYVIHITMDVGLIRPSTLGHSLWTTLERERGGGRVGRDGQHSVTRVVSSGDPKAIGRCSSRWLP